MANISMDPRPTNYLRQNIVFSKKHLWSGSPSYWLGRPSCRYRLQPWSRHCTSQVLQEYSVRSRWARFCWWCNIRHLLEGKPRHSSKVGRSYLPGNHSLKSPTIVTALHFHYGLIEHKDRQVVKTELHTNCSYQNHRKCMDKCMLILIRRRDYTY